jgi:hypothetical protein
MPMSSEPLQPSSAFYLQGTMKELVPAKIHALQCAKVPKVGQAGEANDWKSQFLLNIARYDGYLGVLTMWAW